MEEDHDSWTVEMAPRLRALATLAESRVQVLTPILYLFIYTWLKAVPLSPALGDLLPSSGYLGHLHA